MMRPALLRLAAHRSRLLSTTSGATEMGIVMEPFQPPSSWLKGWTSFSSSTLAVVQLRNTVQGWTVPKFREEAEKIYVEVGDALAAADHSRLRKLTTPSCFSAMAAALRDRPKGQRQRWKVLNVKSSIRQVRIGHHATHVERRFAQVTCSIDADLIWEVTDRKGAKVGGLGTADEPHTASDYWVFERCIAQPPEPPAWRLKERLVIPQA